MYFYFIFNAIFDILSNRNKMISRITFFILLLFLSSFTFAETINIIPKPVAVELLDGAFSITPLTKIIIQQSKNKNADQLQWIAHYIDTHFFGSDSVKKKYNVISSKLMRPQRIVLSTLNYFKDLGNEGYKLSVFPDLIIISGNTPQGIFYGVQSLFQLAKPVQIAGLELYFSVQGVSITDFPRFNWRAMQLDIESNFITKQEIKNKIDLLAKFKLNVLQWQLSNNEKWLIETLKYPKLTTNLSTFILDSVGFYTQNDIKEIVEYASKRYVTVVPQIQILTNAKVLKDKFSELDCDDIKPISTSQIPVNQSNTLCPNDSTALFIRNILTEVFSLFPSTYINICSRDIQPVLWQNNTFVKNMMLEKGFANQSQLFYYYYQKFEKYITLNGKKMISYEGSITNSSSKNTLVLNSKTEDYTTLIAKNGNTMVLNFKDYTNLDMQNLEDSLKIDFNKIYQKKIIPDSFGFNQSELILGIQGKIYGNLFVKNYLSRFHAILSEVCWTIETNKNYLDFEKRFLNLK